LAIEIEGGIAAKLFSLGLTTDGIRPNVNCADNEAIALPSVGYAAAEPQRVEAIQECARELALAEKNIGSSDHLSLVL
jgi:hypothetical protein